MTSAVEAAVREFALGRPVVVTDHPDREDEGDLIVAGVHATAEIIAFMMRECRGLICAPMLPDRAARLDLPLMVERNTELLRTAFTVSVDAASGATTGISASDRSRAVAVLCDPGATAGDLVRPGHMFPLIADVGGVVARPGHTEAAIDLARLAGLPPVGVICEIAGDDGEMLRGESLRAFCQEHGLVQVSIDEMIDALTSGAIAPPQVSSAY
ncbi:3,4-dihydroxy-2-butanone-4-phosphate synthase [Demequina capsici]|uniref:3,4-dihydroxy-2-butanone 4-phosphate synthase n=1 Tax=Demequina capsici TaxID=3075620 RepID=A0AA96FDU0_9MICO|nr:3,4-dihydroxy-2-butanone-4-phosphate synthase [Demequina sp. PMTSA13]WNM27577.1 3,4-dihydroxy-2-butanone-4-phosphate synthase [Demequina sp. PMTSA13]